jgi:hypothetical protein
MSANAIPFNPTSLHDSEDGCVPLLTVVEAAEFLKLSPGSLYHLVSEKRVPVSGRQRSEIIGRILYHMGEMTKFRSAQTKSGIRSAAG